MIPSSHKPAISKTSAKRYLALLITAGLLISNAAVSEAEISISQSRVNQYTTKINTLSLQGNISIIEQQGNYNQASVIQSRSASYQFANFSKIYQRGNNNLANISQSNGNNVGVIWQVGNNHNANISQQGNSLSFQADIYQLGFSGDVTISQSGSGLRGVSVQQQNYSGNARPVTIDTY
ncbi:hypothetical protein [Halomonas sp. MES3-P3E]|uniref:hypothetical protein n=1 Tax=Halomonas sp. MES3-P3E TaxID=2058321 RepID=UPI000C34CD8C|nr:hypothetical protein [Halomonas sp. MES3-P3E]PKG54860.1 hypothetical protein CXF87_00800 [Halomonas sp. MES3-P3E]